MNIIKNKILLLLSGVIILFLIIFLVMSIVKKSTITKIITPISKTKAAFPDIAVLKVPILGRVDLSKPVTFPKVYSVPNAFPKPPSVLPVPKSIIKPFPKSIIKPFPKQDFTLPKVYSVPNAFPLPTPSERLKKLREQSHQQESLQK